MTTAYWWRGQRNFGDLLTPTLLSHYCKLEPEWEVPEESQLLVAGSVLDVIPATGWNGIVAGAGKLHETTRVDLTSATVLAVRGRLTAAHISTKDSYVLGDPGLLASELAPVERGKHSLGVVPHWTDTQLYERELNAARRYRYAEPYLIDISQDPLQVIGDIGSCDKIISSSLHGIIVADSFGIPRRAEIAPKLLTSPFEGGRFKFEDYASIIEQPIEFGERQLAPRIKIERIQTELFDMFKVLRKILNG